MRLSVADVEQAASVISAADVLLLQLEVPIEASQRAAEIAKSSGARVVLNPAPARELSAWTKLNLYCSPQCFGHESVPSGVFVVW